MAENTLPAEQTMHPIVMLQQAIDKGADPSVIEKMMDLQERFERNEAAKAFTDAVSAFQGECPQIKKTKDVSFGGGRTAYKYAPYEEIMRIVQPLLTKHGIDVSFSMEIIDGAAKMTCSVSKGIHTRVNTFTCPVPKEMKVNDSQKMGSARSYGKRYALEDALNIVTTDQDDDGGSLVQTITENEAIGLKEIADQLDGTTIQKCLAKLKIDVWGDLPTDKYGEVRDGLKTMVEERKAK